MGEGIRRYNQLDNDRHIATDWKAPGASAPRLLHGIGKGGHVRHQQQHQQTLDNRIRSLV
jgi:hypothetical protein